MADFYSMEEAARVLGISLDELKLKIQSGELRQIGGGVAPQFRKGEVDEFARRQGLGSDPDLQSDLSLDDLDFNDLFLGQAESDLGAQTVGIPQDEVKSALSTTSHEMDVNPMGSASGVTPGESDIQVVRVAPQGASDSDVRIAPVRSDKGPSDSDVTLLSADSVELDLSGVESGKPGDTSVGTVEIGSSGEIPLIDDDSDFELSPSGVIDALRPESGSDFELAALDSSSEFDVPGTQSISMSDVSSTPAGSGVNLSKPNDSGIGLAEFDADSIELAPLDDAPQAKVPAPAPVKPPAAKPGDTGLAAASAFDDTDFRIDDYSDDGEGAADFNPDQTVQIEESSSDFELVEQSDEMSLMGGEESPLFDDDSMASVGSQAIKGDNSGAIDDDSASGWDLGGDSSGDLDEFADPATAGSKPMSKPSPALVRAGVATEWGTPWVVGLCFSTAMMLLLCMVAFDLLRNLYEFRGDTPVASGLVKQIAGLMGGK